MKTKKTGKDRVKLRDYKKLSEVAKVDHEEEIDMHKPENPPAYGAVLPQTFADNYRFYKEQYDKQQDYAKQLDNSLVLIEDLRIEANRLLEERNRIYNAYTELEEANQQSLEISTSYKQINQNLAKESEVRLQIIQSLKAEAENKTKLLAQSNENHVTELLLLKTNMVSMLQMMKDNVERGCLYIRKHNIDFDEMIQQILNA